MLWRTALRAAILLTFKYAVLAQGNSSEFRPDPSPSQRRTNFCPQAQAVLNGNIPIHDGLRGMELQIAIVQTAWMQVNATSGTPQSGYMYQVLNLLAERAGFIPKYYYVKGDSPLQSWSNRIQVLMSHVDLIAGYSFTDTIQRRTLGIGFTKELVDNSFVLVAEMKKSNNIHLFALFEPFEPSLWFTILTVILLNGVLCWFVNVHYQRKKTNVLEEEEDERDSVGHYLYRSFGTFTAFESIEARNSLTIILNIGYSFFILIVVAAYTANLASVLISTNVAVSEIKSIDDCSDKRCSVCVISGGTAHSLLLSYKHVVPVPLQVSNTAELLKALSAPDQKCKAALVANGDWQLAAVLRETNPDCELSVVGPVVRKYSGAWPYMVDFSDRCTSFVESVLAEVIVGARADFSLDTIWNNILLDSQTNDCAIDGTIIKGTKKAGESDNASQLSIINMSGVFIIYAICAFLALSIYLYETFQLGDSSGHGKYTILDGNSGYESSHEFFDSQEESKASLSSR